jgi:cytochrome c-type biogenesis protein CcmE
MTRTRRRRLLWVGLLLAGLGLAVALGLSAFRQNILYFYPPSDVAVGKVPIGRHFRLGGLVEKGSVQRHRQDMVVRFRVSDCHHSVPVRFAGTLPDLFRSGQGVVASGHLNAHGVFVADRVLAKHSSNYMSPAVAKATHQKSKNPCMPADLRASR